MRALVAALLLATAAAADPAGLVGEVEATSIRLARKIGAPDLGRLTGKPVVAPDGIVLELETVPELVPALADELARHPALDFSRASLRLARTARALKLAGPKAARQLWRAQLRLAIPIAKPDAAAAKRRAALLRHVKTVTTSDDDRFLAGELLQLRDLALDPGDRLSLNVIAVSRAQVVSGVKALRHLRDVRVRRVTDEPYRDRTVYSFELQAVGSHGAPAPDTAALEAALSLSDAWEKAHAPAGASRAGVMESVRFEAPLPDGRVPIDFAASGLYDMLRRLPALMAAARIDGAGAMLAVANETKTLALPDATGAPVEQHRLRITFTGAYAPPRAPVHPPPFAPLVDAIGQHMTTSEAKLWAAAPPVKLRDVRVESDGRVQMNVLGLDLASIAVAYEALKALTTVQIKRFTWEPYRDKTIVSSEMSGRLGFATDQNPGHVIAALEKMLSAAGGRPESIRVDGRGVEVHVSTTMTEQPNVEAGLRSVDAKAKITSRPFTRGVTVIAELEIPALSK